MPTKGYNLRPSRTSVFARRKGTGLSFPVVRSAGVFPFRPLSRVTTASRITPAAARLATAIQKYAQLALHSRLRRPLRKAMYRHTPRRPNLKNGAFKRVYKHIQPKTLAVRYNRLRGLRAHGVSLLGARRTK